MGVKLPIPLAPFQKLEVQGDSITIDVSAKRIVIPTDNQLTLPSFNQWAENPSRCNLTETPCGGLKNSIVQDKSPGALTIEGDGCYLQNITGTYTGKSMGAGKLSETTSIKDTSTIGLEFATADGVIFRTGDGVPLLLRPPSCIVEEFQVINISNVSATYAITVQCPDSVDSIELYNIDAGRTESISFTKVGNSYSFSKSIDYNSSEKLQITIKYQSLAYTTEFTNDANQTIGLQNMSKSWIALLDAPKTDALLDLSGNDNVGTLSNTSLTYDNLGNPYGAVAIDGVDSYINCGNSSILNVTTAMTVVCWLKVLSYPTTYPRIMSKELTNLGDSFGIYLRSSNNNLGVVFNGVTDVATSAANSIDSGWNRIVFTFNKPTALFYINGSRSGSAGTYNFNIQATVYDLLLGNNSAKTRYSNILLTDVRFYNRALSQAEVTADAAGQHVSTTGLIGQWKPYQPSNEIDIFSFTERPTNLSYKQETDGTISQITLYPGNGAINHSRITHPNHSNVSGTGYIPDCLNTDIEGSVAKFFKSYGMKNDFLSDSTITTWIVPAISDEKILPLSPISDSFLGDKIDLRMCPGEYGCASFAVKSDKNINLELEASDLVCGENTISNDAIDIKVVKCWYQAGVGIYQYSPRGRYLTPELLLHDNSLVLSGDDWNIYNRPNQNGRNYLKLTTGNYVDTSTGITQQAPTQILDADTLQPINVKRDSNYQFWIQLHIPNYSLSGEYTNTIFFKSGGCVLKTITLNVIILPITLPSPSIEYSLYYRSKLTSEPIVVSALKKTVEQYTYDIQNMAQHGVTNPVIFAPDSITDFSTVLSIRHENGIDNSNILCCGPDIGSDDSIIQDYTTVAKTNDGASTVYIYGFDEQDLNSSTCRALINHAHGLGVKVFNAQLYPQADAIADILDLCAVTLPLDSTLAAKYHNYNSFDGMKHKIYSYSNPQAIAEYPRTYRLNFGLDLWQHGYDGAINFAYQFEPSGDACTGNVWDDWDRSDYRDHCYTYPTLTKPIDTIQWEGYREASNDIKYLTALQIAIMDAKNRGVVTTDIDSWLATLKTSDLANADLDVIRGQMIDYILQLQSSENYSAVLMENGKAILFKDGTQLFLEG